MTRHCFRQPLVVRLALPLVVTLTGCVATSETAPSPVRFELARETAPPGLLSVVREKLPPSWLGDMGRLGIGVVRGRDTTLYVVDPSVIPPSGVVAHDPSLASLCGTGGCRYLAYLPKGNSYELVFDVYLYDKLPPGIPLFQSEPGKEPPCLLVTEFPDAREGAPVRVTRYCYTSGRYQVSGSPRLRLIPTK